MDIAEFISDIWFVAPILWCACGIIWFIRGRGSAGSIVGGAGFFLLLLSGIANALFTAYIAYLLGQILILVGLATTKWKLSGAASTMAVPLPARYAHPGYPARPGPGGPRPDAPRPSAGDEGEDERGEFEGEGRGTETWGPDPQDAPAYGYAAYQPYAPGPYPYPPTGYAQRPWSTGPMGPPARQYRPGWSLAGTMIGLGVLSWVFIIAGFVFLASAGGRVDDEEAVGIIIAFALGFLASITAAILFYVWLYRAWSAVPPEYRSASPGTAVGYMFIPFFNLYWVFRAFRGSPPRPVGPRPPWTRGSWGALRTASRSRRACSGSFPTSGSSRSSCSSRGSSSRTATPPVCSGPGANWRAGRPSEAR